MCQLVIKLEPQREQEKLLIVNTSSKWKYRALV